jgi:hypothetical protein
MPFKKLLLLSFLTLLIAPFGKAQQAFQKSFVVPIAYGEVAVEEIEREEFMVEVEVDWLTDPQKIDDNKKYYAVWAKTKKDTNLLGILNLNDDMHGQFMTQTKLEDDPEHILISAEPARNPESTSEYIVLKSEELNL